MIENQPNELTLIFHSDKAEDQKTRAYVETLGGMAMLGQSLAIKTLDLKREKLTETQLAEIANKLEVSISTLIDQTYADRADVKSVADLRDEDVVKLLAQSPILLHTPIMIIGAHAFQFSSSFDFIKETAAIVGIRENSAANVEERKDT